MALIKILRVIFGLSVFPFVAWAVVSLFRGDFGGLGIALLGALIGFALWAACHSTLERREFAASKNYGDAAIRSILAEDWEGAVIASQSAVRTIRTTYTRDRGQQEFALPYAVNLVIHALALGSAGQLRLAGEVLDTAEQLLESKLPYDSPLAGLLSIIDDLQSADASVSLYREYAHHMAISSFGR